jgi:hypothetical protein
MFSLSRRTTTALVVCFGLLAMISIAEPGCANADSNDIAHMLRAGGFVIVVRHGATLPDQADTDPLNFDNIVAQRNLNDKGKALAKAFGDAVRRTGIPVGKVYTSKYNRAYETAVIAGLMTSRRPRTSQRAASLYRRTRRTGALRHFTRYLALHQTQAPTPFSLRTGRTSSILSGRRTDDLR